MNVKRIRTTIALMVVVALAGCSVHKGNRQQVADENCEYPDTMTCEEFAGELFNCVCANEGDLRRMFEVLRDQ